jgi:hypothetical protein
MLFFDDITLPAIPMPTAIVPHSILVLPESRSKPLRSPPLCLQQSVRATLADVHEFNVRQYIPPPSLQHKMPTEQHPKTRTRQRNGSGVEISQRECHYIYNFRSPYWPFRMCQCFRVPWRIGTVSVLWEIRHIFGAQTVRLYSLTPFLPSTPSAYSIRCLSFTF